MPDDSNPNRPRILLVKLSSMGDVLHALPTLEALRLAFPQGHFTWLVESAYAPLLAGHPALDEVWKVPRLRLSQKVRRPELVEMGRLIRQVRARDFDLVIDLQGLLKSALWVALAPSPRKVGYRGTREGSYLVLTERVPPYDREAHAVWRYLNLAHYLGAPPTLPRFRLGLDAGAHLGQFISEASSQPLVVLHPGARWSSKLWPAAEWARLAHWLGQDCGLQVILTGSAGDRNLAVQITASTPAKIVNLVGKTSLAELTAIMRRASLAVTTDTGPMHLAAALGTRVVALFGPTAPWRTGPFGSGHEILRLGLSCSPCFKRRCDQPRCLTELTWETVKVACEKVLSPGDINC